MSEVPDQIKKTLLSGGVVAFPTETFYGLAVDPRNAKAVDRLLLIKGREAEKGVPFIVDTVSRVAELLAWETEEIAKRRLELQNAFWPGPLSIVIEVRADCPIDRRLCGPGGSIAIRQSSQPVARELAKCLRGLVTATSANRKGLPPPRTATEVRQYFPEMLVVERETGTDGNQLPSTIIDVQKLPFKILREGAVSKSELIDWL